MPEPLQAARSRTGDVTDGTVRPHAQVLVVGSANVDYIVQVDRHAELGQTILGRDLLVAAGGKGGNQAVAAARMGVRTALVACVGDDADGRWLTAELARAGVDVTAVAAFSPVRTGTAFVTVDSGGENLIVVAPGANQELAATSVFDMVADSAGPDTLVVAQTEIPLAAVRAAAEATRSVGARFVLNLAPFVPIPQALMQLCDPLVLNESEASELLALPIHDLESAGSGLRQICRTAASAVITLGAQGAMLGHGDRTVHVPAEAVVVTDTTGAGDAFTGALAAALATGADLIEATRLGVAAGSWAVRQRGAQESFPSRVQLTPAADRAVP